MRGVNWGVKPGGTSDRGAETGGTADRDTKLGGTGDQGPITDGNSDRGPIIGDQGPVTGSTGDQGPIPGGTSNRGPVAGSTGDLVALTGGTGRRGAVTGGIGDDFNADHYGTKDAALIWEALGNPLILGIILWWGPLDNTVVNLQQSNVYKDGTALRSMAALWMYRRREGLCIIILPPSCSPRPMCPV